MPEVRAAVAAIPEEVEEAEEVPGVAAGGEQLVTWRRLALGVFGRGETVVAAADVAARLDVPDVELRAGLRAEGVEAQAVRIDRRVVRGYRAEWLREEERDGR